MSQTFEATYNLTDIQAIAEKLLEAAGERRIWTFTGDLGAGKTTLIKALCAQLGVSDRVTSPTFSLVQAYQDTQDQAVYHLDLYRVEDMEEALAFGIEEYLDSGAYCFIEWPDVIEPLYPEDVFRISLHKLEGNQRKLLSL